MASEIKIRQFIVTLCRRTLYVIAQSNGRRQLRADLPFILKIPTVIPLAVCRGRTQWEAASVSSTKEERGETGSGSRIRYIRIRALREARWYRERTEIGGDRIVDEFNELVAEAKSMCADGLAEIY